MFRRMAALWDDLFRRRRWEDDLDEELRSSFEMIVERHVARGMRPSEARRVTRLEFEGLEQTKENVRDQLVGAPFHALSQDLRYAWRGLCRRPAFAALAVAMLALGIGVNTSIFSVFYGVLLRPLPYSHPQQLVLIWTNLRTAGNARAPVSGAILHEVQLRNRSLADVAGIWTLTRTFTGDEPEQVKAAMVTANFFDLLGVHPAHGRTFQKEDKGGPSIVLSSGLFRRRFAGNEELIGRGVPMDRANTLIGVLPADFELQFAPDANIPSDVQVFLPFGDGIYGGRNQYYIRMVARLRQGVTLMDAQRDLTRVAAEIRGTYPEYADENVQFQLTGMQADAVRNVKPALNALFAGSLFVLLISCVNVASLLLTRATDRRKEIALRLSLGASRGRVLRQLLIEGGLLSLLGGVAGIAVGWLGFRGLLAIRPERLARIAEPGLSWPVLAFAAACSITAAMIFAVVPAGESFRLELISTLRAGGRGWTGRTHRRSGAVLIAGEITLAFVLVTGAALSARSLAKVEQVRPGFEPKQLLAFQVSGGLPVSGVANWEQQLSSLPGVQSVGATSHLPLDADIPNWYGPYQPEGVSPERSATLISDLRCVTAGYFEAMGARLLEGRYFDDTDGVGTQPVIIIDESIARTVWPGQSPIGRYITAEHVTAKGFLPVKSVVIGMVQHIHNHSLTSEMRGQIYMPFLQSPRSPLSFVVRTQVPPLSLVPSIRLLLRERSKTAAMAKVRTMDEYVAREISPLSFTAVLASVFGLLALLLATTGIYGVLSYQVSQRRGEMGVRMALGARKRDVIGLVMREGVVLASVGVFLGVACAVVASRWLGALLYGVGPFDPLSYGLALVLLPGAAMLGCWRPAQRASRANPADVIREL